MLNQQETGVLLEQLPEVIEERKTAYKKASEKISDPYLKELFKAHSTHSEILIKEIKKFFPNGELNLTFLETSFKWKYWLEMKSALKSGTRSELLSACIEGEQRCINLYQELLTDPHYNGPIKTVLSKQLKDIKVACDLIKIFKICL